MHLILINMAMVSTALKTTTTPNLEEGKDPANFLETELVRQPTEPPKTLPTIQLLQLAEDNPAVAVDFPQPNPPAAPPPPQLPSAAAAGPPPTPHPSAPTPPMKAAPAVNIRPSTEAASAVPEVGQPQARVATLKEVSDEVLVEKSEVKVYATAIFENCPDQNLSEDYLVSL